MCFLFCRLQNEKWMNVRVGDIIKLENNQFVAVSVCLLEICLKKKFYGFEMNTFHYVTEHSCQI